jgi:hypothetical protein
MPGSNVSPQEFVAMSLNRAEPASPRSKPGGQLANVGSDFLIGGLMADNLAESLFRR